MTLKEELRKAIKKSIDKAGKSETEKKYYRGKVEGLREAYRIVDEIIGN